MIKIIDGSKATVFLLALLILSAPLSFLITNGVVAQPDGVITIEGNDELRQLAAEKGWAGAGTKGSPIIITNMNLSVGSEPMLSLTGTDLYVRITGLVFANSTSGMGASLVRAANVEIDNCLFLNMGTGVRVISSQDVKVRDCDISNCSSGVSLLDSRDCIISYNQFSLNDVSLELVTSSGNTIDHNDLTGKLNRTGISLHSSGENTITNNVIQGGRAGINLTDGRLNLLRGNTLRQMEVGVVLGDLSSGNVLRQNAFQNIVHDGVEVWNSTDNKLWQNVMTGCSINIKGDREAFATQTIPENNTVNGRPVVYRRSLVDPPALTTRTVGQLILGDVKGLTVDRFVVNGGSVGMCLGYCTNVTISNSTLTSNDHGILAVGCDELTLSRNSYSSNQVGSLLRQCDDCDILQETHSLGGYGVVLEGGSCTEVRGATMDDMASVGILVWGGNDQVVHECLLSSAEIGIQVNNTHRVSLHENQMDGCGVGSWLEGKGSMEVNSNLYQDCAQGTWLRNSTGVTLISEIHQGEDTAIWADNSTVSIVNCRIDDGRLGIILDHNEGSTVLDCQLTDLDEEAITVRGGMMDRIYSNHIWNTSRGVLVSDSSGTNLSENLIEDILGDGIVLSRSNGSLLVDNLVTGCFHGAYLIDSHLTQVSGNNLSHCYDGLVLFQSSHSLIQDNQHLGNSRFGIMLIDSFNNSIHSNNMTANLDHGLCLVGSDNNDLIGNDLVRNAGSGVHILSGASNQIFDNAFFQNNGAGETYSPSRAQAADGGQDNSWYRNGTDPRGNFWSDLAWPDADGDSIIDVPYPLAGSSGSRDLYPLGFPTMTVPEAPQQLYGLGRNGRVWMEWQPPQQDGHSPLLEYVIYRGTGNSSLEHYATVPAGVHELVDEKVVDGTTYLYEVRARNMLGEGAASATLSITPSVGPMIANGNEELRQLAFAMGWSGDGTASHPFLFSDSRIGGAAGQSILSLVGTDLHLVIENVTFERFGQGEAVSLFRVSHLTVSNCSFLNGTVALQAFACQDLEVRQCLFLGNDVAFEGRLITSSAILGSDLIDNNQTLTLHSCSSFIIEDCLLGLVPGSTGAIIRSSHGLLLSAIEAEGGEAGLEMTSSSDNIIAGADLHDLGTGIVLDDLCSRNTVLDSSFHSIRDDGIVIRNATATSLHNNTFLGCSIALVGDEASFGYNDITDDNTVNGGEVLYLGADDDGASVADLVLGELIVGGAAEVQVRNITILAGGSLGLCIGHAPRISVEDCVLEGLDTGASLIGCDQARLEGNRYHDNDIGLVLERCLRSLSINETFNDCGQGLSLIDGDAVAVHSAKAEGCDIGLSVQGGSGITITSSTGRFDGIGCLLQETSNATLADNEWSGCEVGVGLRGDRGSTVRSDRMEHCLVGLEVLYSQGTKTEGNSYQWCDIGVRANGSENLMMTGDRFGNASDGLVLEGSEDCIISSAILADCGTGLQMRGCLNCTIDDGSMSRCREEAIIARGGEGNRISNNEVQDTSRGILLHNESGALVDGNHLRNVSEHALLLNGTEGSWISGNTLEDCLLGLVMLHGQTNLVINNTVQACFGGMLLRHSNDNDIVKNRQLWGSDYNLALFNSDGNRIIENNISFSANYGLGLFSSDGNVIEANDLQENQGPGMMVHSGSGNMMYDNAFFGNNLGGTGYASSHLQAYDAGQGTIWYTSNGTRSYGNFWSDWTGPDADLDSIVDSPYLMAGPNGAMDPHPLTSPNLAPPSSPLMLTGLGRNATVLLTWSSPADDGDARILNYTVYRAVENGSFEAHAVLGNATWFMDGNVTNGANYSYSVSATNLMGEGPRSMFLNITPIGTAWEPRNLTANATAQYVLVNWTEPLYLGGSQSIFYRLLRGTEPGNLTLLAELEGLEYNDSSVENGVTYHYAVVAVNEAGPGNLSLEANATVPVVPPFAPTYVQALLQGSIAIINWTAPSFDGGAPLEGYRVYRSENGVWTSSPYGFTNATSLTFADSSLSYGSSYVYAVAAYHYVGEGPRAESGAIVPITVPGQPTGLEATMIGTGDDAVSILQWQAPDFDGGSPILGYIVLRGMSGEAPEEVARVMGNSFSDEDVVGIATYIYSVQAYNAAGEGEASEEVVSKKTRTLFGRVLNGDGEPVPNATVSIDGRTAVTDWRGLFTIEALPGDQTIKIESDQGSLEQAISVSLDSSYIGDFVVEQDEPPLEFLGLFWMWWLLIIALCVVVPLILLFLRRRG